MRSSLNVKHLKKLCRIRASCSEQMRLYLAVYGSIRTELLAPMKIESMSAPVFALNLDLGAGQTSDNLGR